MSGQRRCPVCGCYRPGRESPAEAEEHVRGCVAVSDVVLRGTAGFADLAVRMDAALALEHKVVRRLLDAAPRDVNRAKVVAAVQALGGAASLGDVLGALYGSATRRLLARMVRDGLLRSERHGKNGTATYSVPEPPPSDVPPGEDAA